MLCFPPVCFDGESMHLILLSVLEKNWEKEWKRRKKGKAPG